MDRESYSLKTKKLMKFQSFFSLFFVFHSEFFELRKDYEALKSEVSIKSCLQNASSV